MIFDQYQRYKTVEIIVNLVKTECKKKTVSVLEIGANEDCNLEKLLPKDRIVYSDIVLTQKMKNDDRFIQVNGCNMPEIADGQYDVVVALDVLEHVSNENRGAFIKEVNRVAKYMAIICFPYDAVYNVSAEKRVNSYYQMIFGESHKWLIEHTQNGLPSVDSIMSILYENKILFKEFYHGDIFVWEEMMKALFAVYNLPNGGAYYEQMDKLYAEQMYLNDNSKTSYRVFFMLGDDKKLLQNVCENLEKRYTDIVPEKVYNLLLRCIDDLKYQLIKKSKKKVLVQHQIYFTYDGSFNEENKFIFDSEEIDDNLINMDIVVTIDARYSAIRFDAIEGEECIIKNLCIMDANENLIEYKVVNGTIEDEKIIFQEKDPQIYIDLMHSNTSSVHITGVLIRADISQELIRYSLNDSMDTFEKDVMHNLSQNNASIISETKNCSKRMGELEKCVIDYMTKQEELEKRLNKSEEIIEIRTKQYDEVVLKLNEVAEREKNLIIENNNLKEKCNRMENTISWRMTAILRKIGSLVKKCN